MERCILNVCRARLLVQLKLHESSPVPFERKLVPLRDRDQEGFRCLALELSDLSLPPRLTLCHVYSLQH